MVVDRALDDVTQSRLAVRAVGDAGGEQRELADHLRLDERLAGGDAERLERVLGEAAEQEPRLRLELADGGRVRGRRTAEGDGAEPTSPEFVRGWRGA